MIDCFSVDFVSSPEFEFLVAEISFKNQIICRINKEKGNDELEIEFGFDSRLLSEGVMLKFPLKAFEKTLQAAVDDLQRME